MAAADPHDAPDSEADYSVRIIEYVESAHEAGIKVNAWTVDSVKAIENMINCKVDGIITNFPDVTNGLIDKHTY